MPETDDDRVLPLLYDGLPPRRPIQHSRWDMTEEERRDEWLKKKNREKFWESFARWCFWFGIVWMAGTRLLHANPMATRLFYVPFVLWIPAAYYFVLWILEAKANSRTAVPPEEDG